jgi:hypothetical protein
MLLVQADRQDVTEPLVEKTSGLRSHSHRLEEFT